MKIAFYEAASSFPEFVEAGKGAVAAGQTDGNADVIADGPAVPTPQTSATFALNLAQSQQPDAFVFDAAFPSLVSMYPKLHQLAHGNVLTVENLPFSTPLPDPLPKGAETFVGVNFTVVGRETAKAGIEGAELPASTTGTVLLGNCLHNESNDQAAAGAVAEIKKQLPKVNIVQFDSSLEQPKATAAWTSAIAKTRDLVFAYPNCTTDTNAILQIKNRGVGGDFPAALYSPSSPQLYQALADGKFSGGTVQNYWAIGYIGTKLAIDAARGKAMPKGWIDVPLTPLDKENALEIGKTWASPDEALKAYQAFADDIVAKAATDAKPLADVFK